MKDYQEKSRKQKAKEIEDLQKELNCKIKDFVTEYEEYHTKITKDDYIIKEKNYNVFDLIEQECGIKLTNIQQNIFKIIYRGNRECFIPRGCGRTIISILAQSIKCIENSNVNYYIMYINKAIAMRFIKEFFIENKYFKNYVKSTNYNYVIFNNNSKLYFVSENDNLSYIGENMMYDLEKNIYNNILNECEKFVCMDNIKKFEDINDYETTIEMTVNMYIDCILKNITNENKDKDKFYLKKCENILHFLYDIKHKN